MLKKVFRFILGVLALLLLALGCWLVGLRFGWPLWGAAALFLGLVLGYYAVKWSYRRWSVWRLQRKLSRDMPAASTAVDHRALDQQWRAGIRMLGQGGRAGASAFSLPWLLGLNLTPTAGDEAADALAVKRLYPAANAGGGSAGLSWLFLRRSILLDLTADFMVQARDTDDALWRRLLYWLLKVRRQEPLNGVVLRIDIDYLRQASLQELTELGRQARARMDDLARVMDARMPVWLVLTDLAALPGAADWVERLDPAVRDGAFGYTRQGGGAPNGASEFLAESWPAIQRRLDELRLAQARDAALPEAVFAFPQAVMALQPQVRALLAPAFDATPYAETTLLQGLYFTCGPAPGQAHAHAFTRGLYDAVLPAQRDAWIALERWRNTRRMLRHAAIVAWLLCMAGLFGLQYYAWRDVNHEIERLAAQPLSKLNFAGDIDEDLQSLIVWRDATLRLYDERRGWRRMLPFEGALQDLAQHYQTGFARLYRREVLVDQLDPLVRDALPLAAAKGDNREIAAWAQHLVRRINLLRATFAHQAVDSFPLPGMELQELMEPGDSRAIGIKGRILIGQLYVDYLRWEPRRAVLQAELDTLMVALARLGLEARSPEWLLSWVDMQGEVQPIRMSDFWNVPHDPNAPQVRAGLTLPGALAVNRFADELAYATGDKALWEQRFLDFSTRFRDVGFESWRQFVAAFPNARKQLPNEGAWKSAQASLFTASDPHFLLLQRIASLFDQLPADELPAWVAESIELERIVRAAQTGPGVAGAMAKLRLTNIAGSEQLHALAQGRVDTLENGVARVRGALDATTDMLEYRQQIAAATSLLLMGDGSATDFAARTWSYGRDPQVTESPLHAAHQHVEAVWRQLVGQHQADPVLLGLLRGPLDFTLEYAARAATCSLQNEWQTMVVGAVQSVTSPRLANELLYGERGQVQTFMQGRVGNFVDRDALRYRPREALGMTLPLSGQFFAFASNTQLQQVERAEQRIRDENLRQIQELQALERQERRAEAEQELAVLRSTGMAINIESMPVLVNVEALQGPRRTRLTLQCAQGAQSLDNYNFPTRAQFNWTTQSCGEVQLSIEFPDFTLTRRYPGELGMFHFLDDFAQGQRSFSRADFPASGAAMRDAGLEQVTVGWRMDGHDQALEAGRRMRELTAELAQHRDAVRSARQQSMQAPVSEAPSGELALDLLPQRIAEPCWRPTATPMVASSSRPPAPTVGQPAGAALPAAESSVRSADASSASARGNRTAAQRTVAARLPAASPRPATVSSAPQEAAPDAAPASAPRSSLRLATAPTAAQSIAGRQPEAGGWTLQIGAYADGAKAQRLLDAHGIGYQTQSFPSDGRMLTRIIAGGYADRDAAADAARRIEEVLGSRPVILRPQK